MATNTFKIVEAKRTYYVRLVEVCAPRFRGDTENNRVELPGGGVMRVHGFQLKPLTLSESEIAAGLFKHPRQAA